MVIPLFILAYIIKGGWHWKFIPVPQKYHIWPFDGTQLSSFILGIYIASQVNVLTGVLFGLAWWVGVMVSMGEEAGAVGRFKHAWGPYLRVKDVDGDNPFGRSYGVKKAIQRGVFLGALLALVTGYVPFIIAGATFPIAYFIGSTLTYILMKKPQSWTLAEPIYGLALGIAGYFYLGGIDG